MARGTSTSRIRGLAILWLLTAAAVAGTALGAQEEGPVVRSLADGERQLAAFLKAEDAGLGRLAGLADRVGLATHGRAGLAMAFYDPGWGSPSSPESADRAPRIVVREEFYLDDADRLLSFREMAVDVYEYLLHSVILAWFHLDLMAESRVPVEGAESIPVEVGASVDPDYLRFIRRRAGELMPDAPVETREAQYVTGLASFGSHVLSLYNEVTRARARSDGGDGLCRLLAEEGGLFGLWRHDLQRASYSGYAVEDGPPLEQVDQARFLEEVLARNWTGDPAEDLSAEACAPSDAALPR